MLKKTILTLIITLISTLLYLSPDLITYYVYGKLTPFNQHKYYEISLLLGLFTTISAHRFTRNFIIVFIGFMQLLWIGSVIYFGDVLTPDKIILSTQQFFEVSASLKDEFHTHVQALIIVGTTTLLQIMLHEKLSDKHVWKHKFLGPFLPILLSIGFIRAAVYSSPYILYPTMTMPAYFGPINSFVLTFRLNQNEGDGENQRQTKYSISNKAISVEEPTTVVVVMGESISPLTLPLYGRTRGQDNWHTSHLVERHKNPPEKFKLIPKLGLASGTATIASVPMFIKLSYHPVDAKKNKENLFSLATQSGFKQWYISAQRIKSLQIGGGAPHAEKIESQETMLEDYNKVRDEVILNQLQQMEWVGDKRFIFIHQRANHSGYTDNCSPQSFEELPELKQLLENAGRDRAKQMDIGLRCYDRYLDDIFEFFSKNNHATYVFATADHNELTGENGLWGHSVMNLTTSLVPMMLYTNRPDSEIAETFKAQELITAFNFSRLVAKALGNEVTVSPKEDNLIFVNGTLPFGSAGFLSVKRKQGYEFEVERTFPSGRTMPKVTGILDIPMKTRDIIKAQ